MFIKGMREEAYLKNELVLKKKFVPAHDSSASPEFS